MLVIGGSFIVLAFTSFCFLALGFKFDTSKVTNEIAAINNVIEEFKATIYSGSVDVEEYLNKLNKKLKDQGIDRVIEEMQTQLNSWLAEK